jgi:hypothetical protein
LRAAVRRIASGVGPSYTQKVRERSSLTYECSQLTPSSAFRSSTRRQTRSPSSVSGIVRPPGKVRSIR